MDLYKALGTRLANTNLGAMGIISLVSSLAEPSSKPVEEPKAPEPVSAPVPTPAVAPAPVSAPVSAPAAPAVAPAPIAVPKPNAFSIKAPAAKANAAAPSEKQEKKQTDALAAKLGDNEFEEEILDIFKYIMNKFIVRMGKHHLRQGNRSGAAPEKGGREDNDRV